MIRHLIIFAACFLLGAAVTAAVRTARHHPYEGHAGPHRMDSASTVGMPAAETHAGHDALPGAAEHAGHGAEAMKPANAPASGQQAVVDEPAADKPVNTICAVCGMPVDPRQPTTRYHGKMIGFGCKTCPPKFATEPELYGPAALQNSVVEE